MAVLPLPSSLVADEQATTDPKANQPIFRAWLALLALASDHEVLASGQSSTRFNGIAGPDVGSTQARVRHQAPSQMGLPRIHSPNMAIICADRMMGQDGDSSNWPGRHPRKGGIRKVS